MTKTAILDLDTSFEAMIEHDSEAYLAHANLTRDVRFATYRLGYYQPVGDDLRFFELPATTLGWEWRILDPVLAMLTVILGVVLLYPAAWAIWTILSERALPQSLGMNAEQ